jgi:hypothetical protein
MKEPATNAAQVPALLAFGLFICNSACCTPIKPIIRDLARDPLPEPMVRLEGRDCRLAVGTVSDARPEEEIEGDDVRHTRYSIYKIFDGHFAQDVLDYHDPGNLGEAPVTETIAEGLRTSIAAAGPCQVVNLTNADFVLDARLEHLYGVSATFIQYDSSLGLARTEYHSFYPAGQATLSFTLRDASSGEALDRWTLAFGSLYDPAGSQEQQDITARGGLERALDWSEDGRTSQIVNAVRDVYRRVPARLDQALAEASPIRPRALQEFFIVRLLGDYEHIEIVTIDFATGEVRDSKVVRRPYPVFSAPDHWVVSPYQPARLSRAQYDALVKQLGEHYEVRFVDNLSAARFFGPISAPSAAQSP